MVLTHGRPVEARGRDVRLVLPELEPDGALAVKVGGGGAGGDLGEVRHGGARVEDGGAGEDGWGLSACVLGSGIVRNLSDGVTYRRWRRPGRP